MKIKLGLGLHWDEHTSYRELVEYVEEVEDWDTIRFGLQTRSFSMT